MCPIPSTQQKSLTHFCVVLMCQRAARWEKVKWIPLRLFWQPTQCRHDTQSLRMIVFVPHIFTLADEKSHWCDILLGSLPNKHVFLHLENQFLKKTAASFGLGHFVIFVDISMNCAAACRMCSASFLLYFFHRWGDVARVKDVTVNPASVWASRQYTV